MNIAWAAGIIEGEGSFSVKKTSGIVVCVTMTDLDVLERLKSLFGGYIYPLKKRKAHWKDVWKWQCTGQNAYKVAIAVLPYLLSRRTNQANKLISVYDKSPKRGWEDQKKKIFALRSEGLLHREIAGQLGLERSAISHILRNRSRKLDIMPAS